MKELKLFHFEACPYCKKARTYLQELRQDPRYQSIEIKMIDERLEPEIADQYDYYYVPTFYLGDEKLFEGAMTKEDVETVLKKALDDAR